MSDASPLGVLRRNAVGVPHIVFFVVAAAAPLTTVVGVTPAAFSIGNGAGVPLTYLLVGALYLLFSVGFTAMNRFVSGAGGFYNFIAVGLGRPAGVAGAVIALVMYNAVDIAVYGLFGYFLNDIVKSYGGPSVPWWIYAIGLSFAVYLCGLRKIEFSGRVLGFCMVAEIVILALLSGAILLAGGGPQGVALSPFGPSAVLVPGFGVALVFIVTSFIGFEATVIFGEEARDPRRTIPLATYIAVSLIGVFYAFSTWTICLHYGPAQIGAVAAERPATMYLDAVNSLLGATAGFMLNSLLITSLFAAALSFHNTVNRYLFAIGREGLAWKRLALTHPRHQSPHFAGAVQSVFALGVTLVFAIFGQDPYAVVAAWMFTLASLGILIMQVLVAVSVITFFARDHREIGLFPRLIAPLASGLGLAACFCLMISHLDLISGSASPVIDAFPLALAVLAFGGVAFGFWVRARRPEIYANLGSSFN